MAKKKSQKLGIIIIAVLLVIIAFFLFSFLKTKFSLTSWIVGAIVGLVSYLYIIFNFKVEKKYKLLIAFISTGIGVLAWIITDWILFYIIWIIGGIILSIIILGVIGYFFGVEILAGALIIKKILG